jgi:hypothetical protein
VSSYYLIAVHEEADDGCAHAQLIADTILLRYRGTSLIMSSEQTRALPKTESWVAAWVDFCFRFNPSFFLMSEMRTENSLLERIEVAGRGALVASSQASWKKNKNSDTAELGGKRSFRIGGSGKRFRFIVVRGCNGQLTQSVTWCIQHGARQGPLTRLRRHEYGCGNRG